MTLTTTTMMTTTSRDDEHDKDVVVWSLQGSALGDELWPLSPPPPPEDETRPVGLLLSLPSNGLPKRQLSATTTTTAGGADPSQTKQPRTEQEQW